MAMTLARAFGEERPRQAARARADLDDGDACERPGGAGDLGGKIEVEEEVLAERLAGFEPAAPDHLAQRRQAVGSELIASAGRRA